MVNPTSLFTFGTKFWFLLLDHVPQPSPLPRVLKNAAPSLKTEFNIFIAGASLCCTQSIDNTQSL